MTPTNHSRATMVEGHRFESPLEACRARYLLRLEKRKGLSELRFQGATKVLIVDALPFTCFSAYTNCDGTKVWEVVRDAKPERLRDIVRLWRVHGPGRLVVFGVRRGQLKPIQTVVPQKGTTA